MVRLKQPSNQVLGEPQTYSKHTETYKANASESKPTINPATNLKARPLITPLKFSIQKVNRNSKHGVGIWGNPRVPVSYRMDSGLKKQLNRYLKAKFGSTCRGIEAIGVALLACAEAEVNLSTTIEIKEVNIERNVRSRRKLPPVEVSESISKGFAEDECFKCHRKNVLLTKAQFDSGIVAMACPECLEDYQKRRMVKKVFAKAGVL